MPLASTSGGGGSAADIKAGGAVVEISAKDRLSGQLLAIKAKAALFAGGLMAVGKSIGFIGAAALAPLGALLGSGVNRAADIERMAEELGYTVEQMQRLKYAADVAGVSVEDVLSKPERYKGLMASATVLDAGTIRDAVTAQQAMSGALIDLQNAATPLVSTFVPLVRAVTDFVKANGDMVRVLAVGAAGLVAMGAAGFVLGKALILVGVVVKPAVALVGALLTKTGLIVGAFGGLAAMVLLFSRTGQRLTGDLGKTFENVGSTFGEMMRGITEAIKAGDFDTAFRVFTAGVEAVWYEMLLNMARAFSTFIEGNRDRLIALGSLIGGLKGAGIGGRFGPWGAIIGGGLGAAGGGIAVDQLAKLIEGIASNTGLEARRDEAQKRLRDLVGVKGGRLETYDDTMAKRITAVRGAFRTLGDANQQFGGTDGIQTEQLLKLVAIKDTLSRIERAAVEAANNLRLK